jgi:hypothetical protein
MDEGKTGFEQLLSVVPEGWENKAKGLGALARGREIKNAIDLPRLVFLYLTEGKSFSGTAALLHLAGICSMNLPALKCGVSCKRCLIEEVRSVRKLSNCGGLLPFFVGVAKFNRPKGRGIRPHCE